MAPVKSESGFKTVKCAKCGSKVMVGENCPEEGGILCDECDDNLHLGPYQQSRDSYEPDLTPWSSLDAPYSASDRGR